MKHKGTYQSWHGMKQRCYNPLNANFPNYGARGITVCARWLESYDNFLSDMGESPKGFSIERVDVNGNYEPSNCKWIDKREQGRNRRNVIYLEFEGQRLSLSQWAEKTGISYHTLRSRYCILKKSVKECLTNPKHTRKKAIKKHGGI